MSIVNLQSNNLLYSYLARERQDRTYTTLPKLMFIILWDWSHRIVIPVNGMYRSVDLLPVKVPTDGRQVATRVPGLNKN